MSNPPPSAPARSLSQIPAWNEVESDPQFVAADKPTQLNAFSNWRNELLDASLAEDNAFSREDFDRFQVFSRRKMAELSGSPTWQQDADRAEEQYRADEEARQKALEEALSRKPTTVPAVEALKTVNAAMSASGALPNPFVDLIEPAMEAVAPPEEAERNTLRKVFQDEEDSAVFNGRFIASPSLVLDRAKYKKAVSESSLDREGKLRALSELNELREQVASSVSDNMLKTESTYGDGLIGIGNDFTKMRDYELSRNPSLTEADIVEKWRKQNDHWWKNPLKQTFLGARMAGASLVQQYYGLKSLAGLSDEMDENMLAASTQQLGELGEASKNIGGATLAAEASNQVIQMLPTLLAGPAGRGVGAAVSGAAGRTAARAGFALTGRAASTLAATGVSRVGMQLPRVRALLAEKKSVGQIAKALGLAEAEIAPVAKMMLREQAIHSAGGRAAVVLASGLQSAGSSYPEIRDQVLNDLTSTLDQNDPDYAAKLAEAEKTAVDSATYQALRRGFVTMAVTWAGNKLGGDTGEAALAGSGALRGATAKALKDNFAVYLFKTAGKEVVPEAIEEASDALVNGLADKLTYDPNRPLEQIATDVFESGAWGGFMGGFFGGIKAAANYSAEKQAALRSKPVADLLSTAKGLEETGSPLTAAEIRKQAGELADRAAEARVAAGLSAAPAEGAPPTSGVSLPMMVTRDMKQQLADLGYTQADINQLTPQAAANLIQSGLRKPPVVEAPAPVAEAPAPLPAPASRAATRPKTIRDLTDAELEERISSSQLLANETAVEGSPDAAVFTRAAETYRAEKARRAAASAPVAEAPLPAPASRAATRPGEASAPEAPPTSVASVPMMVTKDMNRQLAELGYTQADINQLTPQAAANLIQSGLRKPPVVEAPAPVAEAPAPPAVEEPAPAPPRQPTVAEDLEGQERAARARLDNSYLSVLDTGDLGFGSDSLLRNLREAAQNGAAESDLQTLVSDWEKRNPRSAEQARQMVEESGGGLVPVSARLGAGSPILQPAPTALPATPELSASQRMKVIADRAMQALEAEAAARTQANPAEASTTWTEANLAAVRKFYETRNEDDLPESFTPEIRQLVKDRLSAASGAVAAPQPPTSATTPGAAETQTPTTNESQVTPQTDATRFPPSPEGVGYPQARDGSRAVVTTPSSAIIGELAKLPSVEAKLNWLRENGFLSQIEGSNSVEYADRVMVLMRIGNASIPFYISTGMAGKKNVAAGKWYAVWGIGSSGWINKGRAEDINTQYGFPVLQKLAKILNEGVGFIDSTSVPALADFDSVNSQMNMGFTPAADPSDQAFWPNVRQALTRVNEETEKLGKSPAPTAVTPASATTPVAAETQTPTPPPNANVQGNIPENRVEERVQAGQGGQAPEAGRRDGAGVRGQVQAQGQAEDVAPAATPAVGVPAPAAVPAKSAEQALQDKATELRTQIENIDPENPLNDREYEALLDELQVVETELQAIEDGKSPAPEAEVDKTLAQGGAAPAKTKKSKAGDPIKKIEKLNKAQKGRPVSKSKLSLIQTVVGSGAVNFFNTRAEAEAFLGQALPPGKYGATVPTQNGVFVVLFADELAEEGAPTVQDVLFHEAVHFAEELLLLSDPEARKLYNEALPAVRDESLVKVMEEIYPGFGAIASDDVRMAEVSQAIIEGKLTNDLVSLAAPQKTGLSKWLKALLTWLKGLVGARPALKAYTAALENFLKGLNTTELQSIFAELEGTPVDALRPPMFAYAGEKAIENLPEERRQFMRDSLGAAKAMAAAGKSSEEIRAATGWFPGLDGKMRWEVPDNTAELVSQKFRELDDRTPVKLKDLLNHPLLFEAYPHLAEVGVLRDPAIRFGGSITVSVPPTIRIGKKVADEGSALSTLLHEVQHAIQIHEGLDFGTNLESAVWDAPPKQIESLRAEAKETFKDDPAQAARLSNYPEYLSKIKSAEPASLNAALVAKDLSKARSILGVPEEALNLELSLSDSADTLTDLVAQMQKSSQELFDARREKLRVAESGSTEDLRMLFLSLPYFAQKLYERNSGEIEARDVQARKDLTPEQRAATAPYSSENIAPEDAIVMFGGGGAQMSMATPATDAEYLALAADPVKNRARLQKMVDAAAKAAGYDSGPWFHSTNREFDVFERSTRGNYGPGIYFTNNRKSAVERAKATASVSGGSPRVISAFVKFQKDVDGFEFSPREAPGSRWLKLTDSNQIKSADPVTYDESGNVIPLSQRFQSTSPSISYSLPPLVGKPAAARQAPPPRPRLSPETQKRVADLQQSLVPIQNALADPQLSERERSSFEAAEKLLTRQLAGLLNPNAVSPPAANTDLASSFATDGSDISTDGAPPPEWTYEGDTRPAALRQIDNHVVPRFIKHAVENGLVQWGWEGGRAVIKINEAGMQEKIRKLRTTTAAKLGVSTKDFSLSVLLKKGKRDFADALLAQLQSDYQDRYPHEAGSPTSIWTRARVEGVRSPVFVRGDVSKLSNTERTKLYSEGLFPTVNREIPQDIAEASQVNRELGLKEKAELQKASLWPFTTESEQRAAELSAEAKTRKFSTVTAGRNMGSATLNGALMKSPVASLPEGTKLYRVILPDEQAPRRSAKTRNDYALGTPGTAQAMPAQHVTTDLAEAKAHAKLVGGKVMEVRSNQARQVGDNLIIPGGTFEVIERSGGSFTIQHLEAAPTTIRQGFFTNVPEVTAMQISKGYSVVVPPEVGDKVHPHIEYDPKTRIVRSVKVAALGPDAVVSLESVEDTYAQMWNDRRPVWQRAKEMADALASLEKEFNISFAEAKEQLREVTLRVQALTRDGKQLRALNAARKQQNQLQKIVARMERQFPTTIPAERDENRVPYPSSITDPAELESFAQRELEQLQRAADFVTGSKGTLLEEHPALAGYINTDRVLNAVQNTVSNTFRRKKGVGNIDLKLVLREVISDYYDLMRRAAPVGADSGDVVSMDAVASPDALLAGVVTEPDNLEEAQPPLTNDEKSLLGIALTDRVLDGDPDRTLRVLAGDNSSNDDRARARQILELHRRNAAFTVSAQTGEVTMTFGPELVEAEMDAVNKLLPKVAELGYSVETALKYPNLARILVSLHEEAVGALLEIRVGGEPFYTPNDIKQMPLRQMLAIAKLEGRGLLEQLDIVRYQIATTVGIDSRFLEAPADSLPTIQEALAQIQKDLGQKDLSPEDRQRLEQERDSLTKTLSDAKTLQAARVRGKRIAEQASFELVRENLRNLLGPMFDMPAPPDAPRFPIEALQRFREELARFGVDTTNWRDNYDSSMQMSAQSLTRMLSYFRNRATSRTEAAKSYERSPRREPLDMVRYNAALDAGLDADTAYQQARIPLLTGPVPQVTAKDGPVASMLAELIETVRESYSFEIVVSAVANGNTSTPVAWKGNQLFVDLNAFPEGDNSSVTEQFALQVQHAMLERMTQEALNRALGREFESSINQALETTRRGEGVHPTLQALEELRMEAEALFKDTFPKETQNVREFVTGLYTNPEFVRALNEQPAAGGTGFKGLLSRAARFIAQLLMDFLNPGRGVKVMSGSIYHTAVVGSLRLMSLSPSTGRKTSALLSKLFFVPKFGVPVAATVVEKTSPAVQAAAAEQQEDTSNTGDATLEETVERIADPEAPVPGVQTAPSGMAPNTSSDLKPTGAPPATEALRESALGLVTSILEDIDSDTELASTVAPEGSGLTLWVTGDRDSAVIHVDANNLAQVVTDWRTSGMSEADIARRLRAGIEEEVDHLEIHRRFSDADLIRIGLGMDPAERRRIARSIAGPNASAVDVARAAGDGPNMTQLEQAKAMAILADEYLRRIRQRVRSGFTTEDVRAITKTQPRSLNRVLAYLTAYFRRVAARWAAAADPISLRAALNTATFLSANGLTVDQITGGIPDIADRIIATATESTAYGDLRVGRSKQTLKELASAMFDTAPAPVRDAMKTAADLTVPYESVSHPERLKRGGDLVTKYAPADPMSAAEMGDVATKVLADSTVPEADRLAALAVIIKMAEQAAAKATDAETKAAFTTVAAGAYRVSSRISSAAGQTLSTAGAAQDFIDPHRAVSTYVGTFTRGTEATLKSLGVDGIVKELERELADPAKVMGSVVDGVVGEDVRKASVKAKAKKRGVSEKDVAEAEADEEDLADAQRRRPRDELAEEVAKNMLARVSSRLKDRVSPTDQSVFEEWFKRVQKTVAAQISARLSDGDPDKKSKVRKTVWDRFLQNAEDADILRQAFDDSIALIRNQLAPGGDPNFNGPPTQEQVDKLTRTLALLEGARAEVLTLKDARTLVRTSFRFREEVKATASSQLASVASLTKMLVESGDLDEPQAKLVARYIEIAYEEQKAKYIQELIKRYQKSSAMLSASAKTVVEKLSRSEQLAQFARMGAFTTEEFYSAVATALELPNYDPEIMAQLQADLAAINEMPEGSIQRLDAGRELSSKVADLTLKQLIKSSSFKSLVRDHPEVLWTYLVEIPTSMWKAGILSGFGTQQVNLVFGSLQSIMDLTNNAIGYAMSAPKGQRATLMARNLFTMFKSALLLDPASRAETITEIKRAWFTGNTRFQSEQTESLSRLERDLPLVGRITKPFSLLGRVMMVIDAVVGVPANVARQRMALAHLATKQGVEGDQLRDLLSSAFSPEETVMREIEQQLDGEAPSFARSKNPKLMREARRNELLEQYRNAVAQNLSAGADIITEGRASANVANLSAPPKGVAGWVMDGIFGGLERKTHGLTSLLVPFSRSLANMLDYSLALSFFPVSFLRAYNISPSAWMPGSMITETYRRQSVERGSPEFYKLIAQGFMSTFLTAGLAMMVFEMFRAMGDDEEPFLAVYGDGPTDSNKRNQLRLRAPFWKPNTLKIGSFYANWKDLPGINLLLGGIASISDSVINAQEKGQRVRLSQFAVNSMIQLTRAMFAKQPLQGLEDASKLLFGRADEGTNLGNVLMKMSASWVGGITNPRILQDLEGMTRGLLSETGEAPMMDTAKTWSDALQSIIPGSSLLFDRPVLLNARGQEVTSFWFAPFSKRLLPDMESPHTDEVITPLVSAGLYLSPPRNTMAFKTWKDPEDRAAGLDSEGAILSSFEPDVAREALILYGERITAMLQSGNTLNRLVQVAERGQTERESAQKTLDRLSDAAKEYAQTKLQQRILAGELRPHWQQ